MIKTVESVLIPKKVEREGNELKVVHSEVKDIVIKDYGFSIPVLEWVFDENQITDENGNETIQTVKRVIHNGKRDASFRTDAQIDQVEALLRSEATLNAMGLGGLVGVYDSLQTISEKIRFTMKVGHLLSNNQDQVRQINWTFE